MYARRYGETLVTFCALSTQKFTPTLEQKLSSGIENRDSPPHADCGMLGVEVQTSSCQG